MGVNTPVASATTMSRLPAYTTILCQSFSPDGSLLVIASDFGKVAVFKTKEMAASSSANDSEDQKTVKGCFWQLNVGQFLEDGQRSGGWSVLDMAASNDLLFMALLSSSEQSLLVGVRWEDIAKKRAKVTWRNRGNLPSQPNALALVPAASEAGGEQADADGGGGGPRGRLFVGGGGTGNEDKNIRMYDVETGLETRSAMSGHEDYLHGLAYCANSGGGSGLLASASEDGTAKVWDPRTKTGLVHTINPSKHSALQRSKVGRWVGAVSISGDWLAVGGGPKAALWHLRTLTPMDPYLPEPLGGGGNAYQGGVHVVKIYEGEQKVITGGDLSGRLYLSNMSTGQINSEIPTASGTTYSVEFQTRPFKMMSIAGSSSHVDICTGNFGYKDKLLHFPTN